MGEPKCDLPFGNETLLQRTIRTVEQFSTAIIISAAPGQVIAQKRYPVVHDKLAGQGPLTGLYDLVQQLSEIKAWNAAIICSCDMPFLTVDALFELQNQFEQSSDANIIVFEEQGRLHPFPGLYSQEAFSNLGPLWNSGKRRMIDLLESEKTNPVSIKKFPELIQSNSLMNINTPDDYKKALEIAGLSKEKPA